MTINELCRQGTELLENADIDNSSFDARCLIEYALGIDTSSYFKVRDKKADTKLSTKYYTYIRRRALGEPLQYIIGEWGFRDCTFKVGKGVLIPRPETELLVEFAERFLADKKKPIIFDLCSGSGCVAISVAKLFPDSSVYAVEKSDKAFEYLNTNIKMNKIKNVTAVKGDIFDSALLNDVKPDLILSNPPYIKSDELDFLQKEVKAEPRMALDGGRDGYDFYRILASDWLKRLANGSAMAVECGEEQADEISQMFYLSRSKVGIINDLSGFPRVVTAIR